MAIYMPRYIFSPWAWWVLGGRVVVVGGSIGCRGEGEMWFLVVRHMYLRCISVLKLDNIQQNTPGKRDLNAMLVIRHLVDI